MQACGIDQHDAFAQQRLQRLGEVLSLAIGHELPVAYLTDGPRIPDDLHLPRRHQLVSRAVSVQMQDEPSEEAMADMFADLYHSPAKRVG